MKFIKKADGSLLIDMAGTMLVSERTIGQQEGDCSDITVANGYVLGLRGGRFAASIAALKWIWRSDNGSAGNEVKP